MRSLGNREDDDVDHTIRVAGLLLAAGAGRRMGRPKALVDDWLARGVGVLHDGGCDPVTVVLGAAAGDARRLLDAQVEPEVAVVVAADWATGMAASLRAGLAALGPEVTAALAHLVDLPDVGADVVRRLLVLGGRPAALARAAYAGTPGHPVLIGRDHWSEVVGLAGGDKGARDYLASHPHEVVECGDLASGRDVDAR